MGKTKPPERLKEFRFTANRFVELGVLDNRIGSYNIKIVNDLVSNRHVYFENHFKF